MGPFPACHNEPVPLHVDVMMTKLMATTLSMVLVIMIMMLHIVFVGFIHTHVTWWSRSRYSVSFYGSIHFAPAIPSTLCQQWHISGHSNASRAGRIFYVEWLTISQSFCPALKADICYSRSENKIKHCKIISYWYIWIINKSMTTINVYIYICKSIYIYSYYPLDKT